MAKIFAAVDKKHSVPFPGVDLETYIEWTDTYLADALIARHLHAAMVNG